MSPDIVLPKQRVAYEDEAVRKALNRILSSKYKCDVEIVSFVRKDIRNTHRCVVSRLYLQLDSCEETTVIAKQFNPNWLGVDAVDSIIAHEALGNILSGKQVAPELYGTVRDIEKGRYWLFMEDIGENLLCGREDFENEEMKHCLGFIEKVARIHLLFAEENEKELHQILQPLIMDPQSRAGWRDRYESAIERLPDYIEKIIQTGKLPWLDKTASSFIAILGPCRPIINILVSQPFVFGHSDMVPEENMVIGCEGEEPIYYFIDWDEVYFGPAINNLPIRDEQEETKQLAIVARYWKRVRGSVFVPNDMRECLMMYKYSRLMRAIHSVYFHVERSIERHLPVSLREIQRAVPIAIKLAKDMQIV